MAVLAATIVARDSPSSKRKCRRAPSSLQKTTSRGTFLLVLSLPTWEKVYAITKFSVSGVKIAGEASVSNTFSQHRRRSDSTDVRPKSIWICTHPFDAPSAGHFSHVEALFCPSSNLHGGLRIMSAQSPPRPKHTAKMNT